MSLRELCFTTQQERRVAIEEISSRRPILILGDLYRKNALQLLELQKNRFCADDTITRASEFWRRLVDLQAPEKDILSPDFVEAWLGDDLKENPPEFENTPRFASEILSTLSWAMPLFLTLPEEVWREWLKSLPEHQRNLEYLMLESFRTYQKLEKRKWLLPEHAASFLYGKSLLSPDGLNARTLSHLTDRLLVFDLGFECTPLEEQLVRELARSFDVLFLKPGDGAAQSTEPANKGARFLRFPTAVAEVKDAVHQVRQWLDAGVSLNDISIVCGDIEEYRVVLEEHFLCEGIPLLLKDRAQWQGRRGVAHWLSRLATLRPRVSPEDLELAELGGESRAHDSAGLLKRLFANLSEREELKHRAGLSERHLPVLSSLAPLKREEWLQILLERAPENHSLEDTQRLLAAIYNHCPGDTPLSATGWLNCTLSLASREEYRLEEERDSGVTVLPLRCIVSDERPYRIVMGLAEEYAKPRDNEGTPLVQERLLSDLGIHLAAHPPQQLGRALQWSMAQELIESVYSFADASVEGQVLTPEAQWLKAAAESLSPPRMPDVAVARTSRLDQIHIERSLLPQVRIPPRLQEDWGLCETRPMGAVACKSLSASKLEAFSKCPFIYAARHLFRLEDLAAMDDDPDPMTRGSLEHLLAEKLGKVQWEELSLSDTTSLVDRVIDEFTERSGLPSNSSLAGKCATRKKLIQLAQRLITFERDVRSRLPGVQTEGTEVPFTVAFDSMAQTTRLLSSPEGAINSGEIKISGRIDRIDALERESHRELLLIDYKHSYPKDSTAAHWLEGGVWQPVFYLWLAPLLPEFASDRTIAVGFAFHSLAEMQRSKGWFTPEAEQLTDIPSRGGSRGKAEDIAVMQSALWNEIQKFQDAHARGFFPPQPKDKADCMACRWRATCRAPHLQ